LAKPKSKNACRQSGGISLIFKSKFKNFVSIVKNTKNFIWSKISKEILSSDTDLVIQTCISVAHTYPLKNQNILTQKYLKNLKMI
jgi:hypothetical protein